MRQSRKLISAIVIVGVLIVGIVVGTTLGGAFWVPKGSGLAAGPIALSYGLMFGFGGAALAFFACRWLPRLVVKAMAWLFGGGAVIIVVMGSWAMYQQRLEMNAYLQDAYDRLPPFELALSAAPSSGVSQFNYDSAVNELNAVADGSPCTGAIDGRQRVKLLEAVRGLELAGSGCADCGPDAIEFTWRIDESLGDDSRGSLRIDGAAVAKGSAVERMLTAMDEVVDAACR